MIYNLIQNGKIGNSTDSMYFQARDGGLLSRGKRENLEGCVVGGAPPRLCKYVCYILFLAGICVGQYILTFVGMYFCVYVFVSFCLQVYICTCIQVSKSLLFMRAGLKVVFEYLRMFVEVNCVVGYAPPWIFEYVSHPPLLRLMLILQDKGHMWQLNHIMHLVLRCRFLYSSGYLNVSCHVTAVHWIESGDCLRMQNRTT